MKATDSQGACKRRAGQKEKGGGPESGPPRAKEKRRGEKQRLVRMDFSTFRQSLILIPTQIIRTSRRLIYRVLAWSSSLKLLFLLHDGVSRPLRC